uniref:HVA22-like protein a n=1 Tax=Nelumbo nucifera TaxID=4432 RepID=A0A822XTE3_NELNU|nr:TPA_asm: hypothetical protein HUJ06_023629 [Nelumbo nucifera]
MGFVALLKLVAKIIDLAWPLITLVYPIYSSILAIESNSNAENQKCLTYWVLYPLIILFNSASLKLIEWFPFWPYLKLMAACWLVLPHFNGAARAYKHIVRPWFLMKPQIFCDWFVKRKEDFVPSGSEDFLVAAERYIKENGSKALSKLITRKASKCDNKGSSPRTAQQPHLQKKCQEACNMEPTIVEKVTEAVTTIDNNVAVASEEVKCMDPSFAWTEMVEHTGNQIPMLNGPRIVSTAKHFGSETPHFTGPPETAECVGSQIPVLTGSKKAQKEWTCALCQVSTNSESDLQSHLHGEKHKAKEAELEANKRITKNKATSIPKLKNDGQSMVAPDRDTFSNEPEPKDFGSQIPVLTGSKKVQEVWTCTLNQVSARSNTDLQSHLHGKNHQANVTELEENKSITKNKTTCIPKLKNAGESMVAPKIDTFSNEPGPQNVGSEIPRFTGPPEIAECVESSKRAQGKWTCTLCRVKASSEIDLQSHLHGRNHKAKVSQLEENKSITKDKTVHLQKLKNAGQSMVAPSSEIPQFTGPPEIAECVESSKKAQGKWTCTLCWVKASSEIDLQSHLHGRNHKAMVSQLEENKIITKDKAVYLPKLKNSGQSMVAPSSDTFSNEPGPQNVDKQGEKMAEAKAQKKNEPWMRESALWCDTCKIRCPGESQMISHLLGKKHKAKLNEQAQ